MADKPDTFADLDALAAKGAGTLIPWENGSRWTYPSCPLDKSGTNLRPPIEWVPASRVEAALAAGTWVPSIIDDTRTPVRALAVVKAPTGDATVRTLKLHETGTVDAAA